MIPLCYTENYQVLAFTTLPLFKIPRKNDNHEKSRNRYKEFNRTAKQNQQQDRTIKIMLKLMYAFNIPFSNWPLIFPFYSTDVGFFVSVDTASGVFDEPAVLESVSLPVTSPKCVLQFWYQCQTTVSRFMIANGQNRHRARFFFLLSSETTIIN